MSSKLIGWLKYLKDSNIYGLETDIEQNKKIVQHILNSKKEEQLGILVQAFKLDNTLISPELLADEVLKHAPLLAGKLRGIPGIDNVKTEAYILKYSSIAESISKLHDWYPDNNAPSSLQLIPVLKLYTACYTELTTGQRDDRVLSDSNIEDCMTLFKHISDIINDKNAISEVMKLAAYIIKSFDLSKLEENKNLHTLHDVIFESLCNLCQVNSVFVSGLKSLISENKKLETHSFDLVKLTYPDIANKLISSNTENKSLLARKHEKNKPSELDTLDVFSL